MTIVILADSKSTASGKKVYAELKNAAAAADVVTQMVESATLRNLTSNALLQLALGVNAHLGGQAFWLATPAAPGTLVVGCDVTRSKGASQIRLRYACTY